MHGQQEDHCRIGSLEIYFLALNKGIADHCRIGSLEIINGAIVTDSGDHCRIGSLEITALSARGTILRSLPHRQLRNPGNNNKNYLL